MCYIPGFKWLTAEHISHHNWMSWTASFHSEFFFVAPVICFCELNHLVQAAIIVSCIWQVPGLNLRSDTDYPDCSCSWISSVPPRTYQESMPTLEQSRVAFSKSFFKFTKYNLLSSDLMLNSVCTCYSLHK